MINTTQPTLPPTMLAPSLCQPEMMAAARGQKIPHAPRAIGYMPGGGSVARREEHDRYDRIGNRVAVITVDGPIWFSPHTLAYWWGGESTLGLGRALEEAADDDSIDTVVLDIHSPGGDVYGGADLMAAAERCAKNKKLVALCRDMCGSMACWLASYAAEIVITPTGCIGCIGTIAVFYDTSGVAEKEGYRAVPITDASLKATGHFGVPLTDEMVESIKEEFFPAGEMFRQAVAKSRGISVETIEGWQGKVFSADAAIKVGLADRKMLTREFFSELLDPDRKPEQTTATPAGQQPKAKSKDKAPTNPTSKRNKAMADEDTKDVADMTDEEKDKEIEASRAAAATAEEEKKKEEEAAANSDADDDDDGTDAKGSSPAARTKYVGTLLKHVPKSLRADAVNHCVCKGLDNTQTLAYGIEISNSPEAKAASESSQTEAELAAEAEGAPAAIGGGRKGGGGVAAAANPKGLASGGPKHAEYSAAINAAMEASKCTKREATMAVHLANPDLRDEVIEEANTRKAS